MECGSAAQTLGPASEQGRVLEEGGGGLGGGSFQLSLSLIFTDIMAYIYILITAHCLPASHYVKNMQSDGSVVPTFCVRTCGAAHDYCTFLGLRSVPGVKEVLHTLSTHMFFLLTLLQRYWWVPFLKQTPGSGTVVVYKLKGTWLGPRFCVLATLFIS